MNEEALSQMYLKDTAFQKLMQRRIFNVLLIASPYDAFMMEEDGRVEEQLYFEYVSLNLSSPPRVTRVSDTAAALEMMKSVNFDIVITMPAIDINETFEGAAAIKAMRPDIPVVVLTPFSKEVSRRLSNADLSHVDYVFSWLGNMDLLLAIIKLIEDKKNADDIDEVGVQMLLLVEDSVRFYSSILPTVYKFLLKQSLVFSTEALNEHEQRLRMRGRPKVMLARDYEEAVELFNRYRDHILGVISDVSFKREGVKDSSAGLRLGAYIRSQSPYLPIIIESSDVENAKRVGAFNGVFLDKNSKKLPVDMGEAIMANFGFGDFIIKDPASGNEIMRIKDLKGMQRQIFDIPADALYRHAQNNDISRWLYSRALFPIAEVIKQHRFKSLDEAPAVKQLFFDLIVKYRKMKNRGVVAVFKKDRFDHYSNFARIGEGSLGGKGRGLAFVDSIIKKNPVCDNFSGLTISIPRTVVLCTDIFDEFMASNRLYPIALSDASDDEILSAFDRSPPARKAHRRLLRPLRGHRPPARHQKLEPARRLSLPAFRRHLLDIYDTLDGRPLRTSQDAERIDQGRLCICLLQGQQGLYVGHEQCHRPGEDGRHHSGSRRRLSRRLLLPVVLGCGSLAQLLPHRRGKHRRRRRRDGGRSRQIYRRRRP